MSIIKGYKGVMDLDLSLVPKMYEKEAVEQHYKDINEYKKYQKSLKPQHRYENTVERIHKRLEKENNIRNEKRKKDQDRRYQLALCRKITTENF